MFLEMGQSKWPIAKNNNLTFVFWDAPQSIELINLNHNKYPSSYESLGKELVMTKVWNENRTQTMRQDKMHFKKCKSKIFPKVTP